MRSRNISRLAALTLVAALWTVPVAALGQTSTIRVPKNKYKVQDDVKLGLDASRQVDRQFPILDDRDATDYVSRVGSRLVASLPAELQQPSFNYRFAIVDARDINAFALPGGPMYVNRGMIEAARNEGEMAGVMAHEISHVALRHATAQATKQSSAKNTLGTLGLILGGAIVGGQAGAQLGMLGAQAWMTKYSREYETQADMLGARIMADAGYDPRDLANMFRTIQGQRSGGGPEWLSSHPDPGNRYEKINREAANLNVSPEPIRITREFQRVQTRLKNMPRARSMAEIERDYKNGRGNNNAANSGRYSTSVQRPSSQTRVYSGINGVTFSVPANWREFGGSDAAQFAPDGAYGDRGITHGLMAGLHTGGSDLTTASQDYLDEVLRSNNYLQQRSGFTRTYVGGRQGLSTSLSGRSPITGRSETVNIYTTQLRSGSLLYMVTVVPGDESYNYNYTFRAILDSLRFGNY